MKISQQNAALWMAVSLATALTACGGGGGTTTTPPPTTAYILTVNTVNPTSGVALTVAPPDNNGAANGSASFTRSYNSGTAVTVTAPVTSGTHTFTSWAGCTSVKTNACSITMNANATITATYTFPTIAVTPNTAIIGTQVQFNAALPSGVTGAVKWSVAAPAGSALDPGTISASGLYNTPYPAPPTVTVTAASTQDTTDTGSATVVTLAADRIRRSLAERRCRQAHPRHQPLHLRHECVPALDSAAASANISINRWGGDATSRYNYKLESSNAASDWYFENGQRQHRPAGHRRVQPASSKAIRPSDAKTIGTVPVIGWVAKDGTSCSFPVATYPNQVAVDPYGGKCGNGIYPQGVNSCTNSSGCNITGVAPHRHQHSEVDSVGGPGYLTSSANLEQQPTAALPSTTSTMSRPGGTLCTATCTLSPSPTTK